MGKRKIIIITRDNEAYKVSKLMKDCVKVSIYKSNLMAFEYAKGKYNVEFKKDAEKLGDWLEEISCYDNDIVDFIAEEYGKKDNIGNSVFKWYKIPDKLIDLPINENNENNENKVSLYVKIVKGDDEIYLLYWNRTKGLVNTPGVLLSLICKDCDIDKNSKSDNYLYIHDVEWGCKGDKLLILESNIKSETHEAILKELINRNFSFAAAFQHHNDEGTYFRDILECKFGEEPIFTALGKIEKEHTDCKEMLPKIVEKYKKVRK